MDEQKNYLIDDFIETFYNENLNPDIMDKLWEVLNEITFKVNSKLIVYISVFGSQNYNLDNENSDLDCECFIFPSLKQIALNEPMTSTTINTKYGTAIIKDIRAGLKELSKSSPNILECFATNYSIVNRDYQQLITEICNRINEFALLSEAKLLRGLAGLWNKYCCYTIDTHNLKYYANVLRVGEMITKIISNHDWTYTSLLIPTELDYLKQIRNSTNFDEIFNEDYFNMYCIEVQKQLDEYFDTHETTYIAHIYDSIQIIQINLIKRYLKLNI